MLMWRLSASLMSNGATLAVKPGYTGSGTRTTPKQAVYWPTLLVPEPIKRAGSYWHCLHPSTSACSPAMTGTAMAGWCRRISIWPAKYSPNALSVIIWRYAPTLSGWLVNNLLLTLSWDPRQSDRSIYRKTHILLIGCTTEIWIKALVCKGCVELSSGKTAEELRGSSGEKLHCWCWTVFLVGSCSHYVQC